MRRHVIYGAIGLFTIIGGFIFLFSSNFHVVSSEESTLSNAGTIINAVEPEAKILFVGDIFFDRYIRQVISKQGGDHIFACIDSLLEDADLVVGNLEGPITENESVSLGSVIGSPNNFVFTFPKLVAELLANHNIRLVNLGNNHISNFGREGIKSTKRYLELAGVNYFGGLRGDEPVYRTDIDGFQLSFVSFNEFGGGRVEDTAAIIRHEKEDGRRVIVYTHWGDEYSTNINRIKAIATLFSQSGAVAIFGSHPHIVLPSEYINGTLVYYSLGNFIFDQYWNDKVSNGLAVMFYLREEGPDIVEHPVKIQRDGRTCPI